MSKLSFPSALSSARRQMALTSYREISAINAVRKIIFPQGQSHQGLGLHGSSTCRTIKDRSAVQSTCTASTTLLRRTSLSTSRKRPLDSANTWTPEVPTTGRRCKNTHRGIEGNLHSVPPLVVSATLVICTFQLGQYSIYNLRIIQSVVHCTGPRQRPAMSQHPSQKNSHLCVSSARCLYQTERRNFVKCTYILVKTHFLFLY